MKHDIKKALRRAKLINKRWRNAEGPHSNFDMQYDEDDQSQDDNIPIEQQIIMENLALDKSNPGPG